MQREDHALTYFEERWRPKMVILHEDGPRLATLYSGGQAAGLYNAMSVDDWAEVLPQPNWDEHARPALARHVYDQHQSWTDEGSWPRYERECDNEPPITYERALHHRVHE